MGVLVRDSVEVYVCPHVFWGHCGCINSPQGSICQEHFPVCRNGPDWHRYVGVGKNHQAPVPERKNSGGKPCKVSVRSSSRRVVSSVPGLVELMVG